MVNGVLNIDKPGSRSLVSSADASPSANTRLSLPGKPQGITSHDVVDRVRKISGQRRVGHAGTLDPFATGVLVVALGSATRLLEYALAVPKTYEATLMLGATSDTDDRTGNITKVSGASEPAEREIHDVLSGFTGKQMQVPPRYAAIKVQGKKLYEYARKGEHVERKPRSVMIHDLALLQYDYPRVVIRARVGSGIYIRALARDIGEKLGTGAYVDELRRTAVGEFSSPLRQLADGGENTNKYQSVELNELTADTLSRHLLPPEVLVAHVPSITLDEVSVAKFKMGQSVQLPDKTITEGPQKNFAIFDETNILIGIGGYHSNTLSPRKVLR